MSRASRDVLLSTIIKTIDNPLIIVRPWHGEELHVTIVAVVAVVPITSKVIRPPLAQRDLKAVTRSLRRVRQKLSTSEVAT